MAQALTDTLRVMVALGLDRPPFASQKGKKSDVPLGMGLPRSRASFCGPRSGHRIEATKAGQ